MTMTGRSRLRPKCRDNGDKGPKAIATTATRRRWATRKPQRRRWGDHRYIYHIIFGLGIGFGILSTDPRPTEPCHNGNDAIAATTHADMANWQSRTATTIHRDYDNDCTDCGYNGDCDMAAVIAWRSQSSDEVIRGNHSDGDKAATIGDYDEVTAMVRPRGSASIPLRVKGNPPSTRLTRSHPYPYARVPVPVTAGIYYGPHPLRDEEEL
ncbi:hypothetical protein EDB85DRAFT_1902727 [Lactarius pseudohatsudake]|nr:hypothetical protein EDB85DRAFT_1902727 [Lactarius pseudohatsudake]